MMSRAKTTDTMIVPLAKNVSSLVHWCQNIRSTYGNVSPQQHTSNHLELKQNNQSTKIYH